MTDPQQARKLRRELGLDRLHLGSVGSYVRLSKTSTQIVGAGNTATVLWQSVPYDIGPGGSSSGGASATSNGLIVPALMAGLWNVRVVLNLESSGVTAASNYKLNLNVNGLLKTYENNQSGATGRPMTARLTHDVLLAVGDVVTVEMGHGTGGGAVTIETLSHMACRYLGTI